MFSIDKDLKEDTIRQFTLRNKYESVAKGIEGEIYEAEIYRDGGKNLAVLAEVGYKGYSADKHKTCLLDRQKTDTISKLAIEKGIPFSGVIMSWQGDIRFICFDPKIKPQFKVWGLVGKNDSEVREMYEVPISVFTKI